MRLVLASRDEKTTLTQPTDFKVGQNNEWLELRELPNGYTYSHEVRCQGKIVLILPYRRLGKDGWEFLVRNETTPCWSDSATLSAMTGGVESTDIREDALRELKEEAGYTATKDQLVFLGNCRASKSSDTIYILYAIDLAGMEPEEALGDGSANDQAPAVWLSGPGMRELVDPQGITAYARLSKLGVY